MTTKKDNYVSPSVEVLTARVEKGFDGTSDSQPLPTVDGEFSSGKKTGESLGNGSTHGNEIFT